jgi:hypothetical protein
MPLREVRAARDLAPGTFLREGAAAVLCFDLPKGEAVATV